MNLSPLIAFLMEQPIMLIRIKYCLVMLHSTESKRFPTLFRLQFTTMDLVLFLVRRKIVVSWIKWKWESTICKKPHKAGLDLELDSLLAEFMGHGNAYHLCPTSHKRDKRELQTLSWLCSKLINVQICFLESMFH